MPERCPVSGRLRVGWVSRPHGLRGEVRVVPDTDFPERLRGLRVVWLVGSWGEEPRRVESVRRAGDAFLFKLEGVDDRGAAERLRGAQVCVPREEAAPHPEGTYYVADLLGFQVVTEAGAVLGVLEEVLRGPAHDVYVVRGPGGEVLLPAVREVVREVRVEDRQITVRPVPGLLEE